MNFKGTLKQLVHDSTNTPVTEDNATPQNHYDTMNCKLHQYDKISHGRVQIYCVQGLYETVMWFYNYVCCCCCCCLCCDFIKNIHHFPNALFHIDVYIYTGNKYTFIYCIHIPMFLFGLVGLCFDLGTCILYFVVFSFKID